MLGKLTLSTRKKWKTVENTHSIYIQDNSPLYPTKEALKFFECTHRDRTSWHLQISTLGFHFEKFPVLFYYTEIENKVNLKAFVVIL